MEKSLEARLGNICRVFLNQKRTKLVFLTGAGLSAESGLPTFRGGDGYWTIGSENYTPQEIATEAFWEHQPWEVWKWSQRFTHAVLAGQPNVGHEAIARISKHLGDRCVVITQNADGYHQAAGTQNVLEIHGNALQVRCSESCEYPPVLLPIPASVSGEAVVDLANPDMRCPKCKHFLRPHALFFDETYNDELYNLRASLNATRQTGLLVIVGTAGVTSLPQEIVETAWERGSFIVDINPERDLFAEKADERGVHLPYKAGEVLPKLAALLGA